MRRCAAKAQILSKCRIRHSSQSAYFDAVALTFNPSDYCFEWTSPTTEDPSGWYKWNRMEAHRYALRDRNKCAKLLRENGYNPVLFSLREQHITLGGIGSGHPEISLTVTVYGLNY